MSRKINLSISEFSLLSIVLFAGVFFCAWYNFDGLEQTILLFLLVTIGGFIKLKALFGNYKFQNMRFIPRLWLIKVLLTIILLHFGWMPDLFEITSQNWGYDPQRYYKYSGDLIENHWIPNFGLNYVGVIYFYAAIFSLFGENPFSPALINILITLLFFIYSFRLILQSFDVKENKVWLLGLLLINPELLWYDALTSREALLNSTLFYTTCLICTLLEKRIVGAKNLFLIIFFAGVIAILRPTILVPLLVGCSVIGISLFSHSLKSLLKNILLIIGFCLLLQLTVYFSSFGLQSNFNVFKALDRVLDFNLNTALVDGLWSEKSIGALLLPDNAFEAVLFVFPRMLLYIISPLPNLNFDFHSFAVGNYSVWQNLMVCLTSISMLLTTPFVLSATKTAWQNRKEKAFLFSFLILFWALFGAIAGGNLIIHERYRVMITSMFFCCAWLGFNLSSYKDKINMLAGWFLFLSAAVSFYLFYRYII